MFRAEKMERERREREGLADSRARASFRQRAGWIGGGAVAAVAVLIAWNVGAFESSTADHPYGDFAQCLTDKNVVMYGVDWCPRCQEQKKMFASAFQNIDYVNCDFNRQVCDAQGVKGYPTWKIESRLIGAGVQTFDALGDASGCRLPEVID